MVLSPDRSGRSAGLGWSYSGSFDPLGETYPLRRAGQPAELASIYVLAANDASYTSGNIYGAGGGGGQP